MYSTGNKIVDKVGMINIEGNVIPHAWYSHFKLSSGKPDLNAMIILSEIVYWYRPTTVRDEATGRVTGIKKKFKADLLQRSYDSFADQFGLTKRQVKEAMDRLCEYGIIWREFRTVKAHVMLSNVLFIGLDAKKLNTVSLLQSTTSNSDTLLRLNVTPSYDETQHPPTLESETYTEITTEITTESDTHAPDENPKIQNLDKQEQPTAEETYQYLKDALVFGSEFGEIANRNPNLAEINVLVTEVVGYWSTKNLTKQQLLAKVLASVGRLPVTDRFSKYTIAIEQVTTAAPVTQSDIRQVSPFEKLMGGA